MLAGQAMQPILANYLETEEFSKIHDVSEMGLRVADEILSKAWGDQSGSPEVMPFVAKRVHDLNNHLQDALCQLKEAQDEIHRINEERAEQACEIESQRAKIESRERQINALRNEVNHCLLEQAKLEERITAQKADLDKLDAAYKARELILNQFSDTLARWKALVQRETENCANNLNRVVNATGGGPLAEYWSGAHQYLEGILERLTVMSRDLPKP